MKSLVFNRSASRRTAIVTLICATAAAGCEPAGDLPSPLAAFLADLARSALAAYLL